MKINACSVAFRHLEVTASDLAGYIAREGFDGLEIWAPHARDLASGWAALHRRPDVPMLSGYLPLGLPEFNEHAASELCDLTGLWYAPLLRLFAGNLGSEKASAQYRSAVLRDLRIVADLAKARGIKLAIETHPDTLADGVDQTLSLIEDLDHPAVGLNFDVLHVWESKADPLEAQAKLAPHILHYHLKNVTSREKLTVFKADNVHDRTGHREGMCPLFQGVLDYDNILPELIWKNGASLEWFGPKPARVMVEDLKRARISLTVEAA